MLYPYVACFLAGFVFYLSICLLFGYTWLPDLITRIRTQYNRFKDWVGRVVAAIKGQ